VSDDEASATIEINIHDRVQRTFDALRAEWRGNWPKPIEVKSDTETTESGSIALQILMFVAPADAFSRENSARYHEIDDAIYAALERNGVGIGLEFNVSPIIWHPTKQSTRAT
jgi:hypothetical protein